MSGIRSKEMHLGALSNAQPMQSVWNQNMPINSENILVCTPFYGSEEMQRSESQNFGFPSHIMLFYQPHYEQGILFRNTLQAHRTGWCPPHYIGNRRETVFRFFPLKQDLTDTKICFMYSKTFWQIHEFILPSWFSVSFPSLVIFFFM